MRTRREKRMFATALFAVVALAGCGSGASSTRSDASPDVPADAPTDVPTDLPTDAFTDLPIDAPTDTDAPDTPQPPRALDHVDPFIGSGGQGWWAGNVSVGAQAPFGMVQAGPDGIDEYYLPWNHCSGYHADDDRIRAFSHAHLHGTGLPDMGALGFMPFRGAMDAKVLGEGHWLAIDKASEKAAPGYYAVTLRDPGLRVELTATEVAAVHRYSFPTGAAPGPVTLLIDLAHTIVTGLLGGGEVEIRPDEGEVRVRVRNAGEFSRNFGGVDYFHVVRFDRPFTSWGTWKGTTLNPSVTTQQGNDSGAWLTFDASDGQPVEVRVGLSFVDLDGAARNIDDLPMGGFDAALARTRDAWEDALGKVRCTGGTPDRLRTFYTALYHAQMMPNRFMDADNRYRGFDKQAHTSDGTVYHTNFSLWDTYRGQHALLMLLQPRRQRDMVRSLVLMAEQGGYMPRWAFATGESNIMIGSPADMVVAETWLKNIRDFDVEAAFASMKLVASTPVPDASEFKGRDGIASYLELGYLPVDRKDQSVARTLEYAIADSAIANLARALGRPEDEATFRERAGNWKNLWNAEAGYFLPRKADGTWITDIDPLESALLSDTPYTEGNALQYLWLVPQDTAGLKEALGGAATMAARLQSFFEEGAAENTAIFAEEHEPLWWMTNLPKHYWQGNEPDFHAAWLFNEAGRPDLTQKWLRWIADTLYAPTRDGLPGNDDAGTLSAWYVWAALGLFPIPGDDRYWLGSPLFERCEVDLPEGKTLVVEAPGATATPYWSRVTWKGSADETPVAGFILNHADLAQGGTLTFTMTPTAGGRAGR